MEDDPLKSLLIGGLIVGAVAEGLVLLDASPDFVHAVGAAVISFWLLLAFAWVISLFTD